MSSLDAAVPALLLRLDRNPFHHGSLGAVRSLGRAGVEVHAFTESPRGPLARSRYLHRAHAFPEEPGRPGAYDGVERALERAARAIGRPAVLIPMDDLGAIAVCRLAARLRGRFLFPDVPDGLPERLADKARLARICREAGIAHPETVTPRSADGAADAAARLGLPAVAKWSRPWLLPPGGGLRSTTLVRDREQARELYAASARAGSPLLLQRLLPGGRGADWFFHGCFTADGRCAVAGTGRKELSWPPRAGLTAVGSWRPNPGVAAAAARLAARLGYRGILDLDFRRDAEGAYHLLDANPRPGAQFRLFADRASGLDVVRALHLDLTGRGPLPAPRAAHGRLFVTENYGLLSALRSLPAVRPAALPAALPALARNGGVETAWFAPDDPAPFLAMSGSWLRRAVSRAVPGAAAPHPPAGLPSLPSLPSPPSRSSRSSRPEPHRTHDTRGSTEPRCTTW